MNKRHLNLDKIRLILAFMIIAIHTYPFTSINYTLDYAITRILFRIAVPIYLMISGYFILNKALCNKKVLFKYVKKISLIYIASIIIYLPLIIKNHALSSHIIKTLIFTGPMYHLWYFPALILGILVSYLIIKFIPKKYQIVIASLLYFIGLLGDNYHGFITSIDILSQTINCFINFFGYTRNFLFYTPIFFLIGYKVSIEKEAIKKDKNIHYIIKLFILMLLEGLLIYIFSLPYHTSMYIFLPILSYFLFKYLITYQNKEENKNIRQISTYVYILHPWIIAIVNKIGFIKNSIVTYIIVSILTYVICKVILLIKIEYKKHHTCVFK